MKIDHLKTKAICLFCCLAFTVQTACRKVIDVGEPINTLTTTEIFSRDATATAAMDGVYSTMINSASGGINAFGSEFSAGLTTALAGSSSDELYNPMTSNGVSDYYGTSKLTALNANSAPWSSAYDIIYKANSVIEGIEASASPTLHDQVRQQLTAQAKFVRAFCYFYLTNFYGDVPMVLTVDFNKTANLPRMPQQQVYKQIITDLKDAEAILSTDNTAGNGERIIPNKWAAALLLARVYLYTGDYSTAATEASSVIGNKAIYTLEADLNQVFSTTSTEAIWQLKQSPNDPQLNNATPEGWYFSPTTTDHHGAVQYAFTSQLMSAFEPNDQRRVSWIDSTDYQFTSVNSTTWTYFPHKYIIGRANGAFGQPPPQYYMVLRLAEAYLIRAEAYANGAPGGTVAAIADLNVIRNRAGLVNLNGNLNQSQLKTAIAKERRIEFMAEWGHRWFDLKRTQQAHAVLSVMPAKLPWLGDYQLLYPIPTTEIIADHFLIQNPGY